MVVGRLNRESYPVKGTMAGFTPQHKLPDGSFIDTGEINPLPTKDDLVYQQLDSLKQLINDQQILTKKVEVTNQKSTQTVDGTVDINNFPTDQKVSDSDVLTKLTELDSKMSGIIDGSTPADVNVLNIKSSSLQEQLTETDAITGTLTFSDFIKEIGIYNRDVSEGVFTVNNLAITIPADTSFQAEIGGTPSKTIDVTGSSSYIIGRYA